MVEKWMGDIRTYGFRVSVFIICAVSVVRSAERPSYDIEEKVPEPRVFAEGVISTADDEIGGTFSPDGK